MTDAAETTAAVLVIGDEILSGRTQDANVAIIARFLAPFGVDLKEVRFVPDIEADIVAAVNALRARYTYVFTTGGIGPTHDDITADAIGTAFGLDVEHNSEALALLSARYPPGELNTRRQRMARMPKGASLVKNSISAAPGFQAGNVFVLAGVPKIMQAMLDDIAPRLARGVPVISRSLTVHIGEGTLAEGLAAVQQAHPKVAIGSYPFFAGSGPSAGSGRTAGTTLVVRGRDNETVVAAVRDLVTLAKSFGIEPDVIESGE